MNASRLAFRLIRGVSLAVFIPILMTAARAGDIVGRVSDGRTGSYLPGVVFRNAPELAPGIFTKSQTAVFPNFCRNAALSSNG